jgi:hypothetical protein
MPAHMGADPGPALLGLLTNLNSPGECAGDPLVEGGLATLRCHLAAMRPIHELLALPAVNVWASGPHSARGLDLASGDDFGHYDPAFAAWVRDHAVPTDPQAVRSLQVAYDAWFQRHARAAWMIHLELDAHPACRDDLVKSYETAVAAGATGNWAEPNTARLLMVSWCADVPPRSEHDLPADLPGLALRTSYGSWWVRRHADGSAEAFGATLKKVLATHDSAWLASR